MHELRNLQKISKERKTHKMITWREGGRFPALRKCPVIFLSVVSCNKQMETIQSVIFNALFVSGDFSLALNLPDDKPYFSCVRK
jgi:hypothetical protein